MLNRTIFTISEGALRSIPHLDNSMDLELKGYDQAINIKQPFRTTVLECVLDYCRIAYDILPQEAALAVALERNEQLTILNDWDWREQNFLHTSRKLSENAQIPDDQERPRSANNNQVLIDKLLDHLFRGIEVKTKIPDGTFRLFYMAPACTKENFQKEQVGINNLFQTFNTRIKERFHTDSINKCTLDVILPIISALRPFTCINEKMKSANPFDCMRLWCIETTNLWDVMMRQVAQRQFGFVVLNIKGIPMKESGSKANNYDVELACKGFSVEISQDISLSENLHSLKWVRAEPKHSTELLHTSKSIHRITPVSPYTPSTLCLMRHLASGKPVTLSLDSPYNTTHSHLVTHMMLQHGDDVYLHVLNLDRSTTPHLSREVNPSLSTDESKPEYSKSEFLELMHKYYTRVSESSSMIDQSALAMLQDEDASNGVNPVHHAREWCYMKIAQYVYQVPSRIERATRAIPLCNESDSVLFCKDSKHQYPTLHNRVLLPLFTLLQSTPLHESMPELEHKAATSLIHKIYASYNKNDTGLINVNNHTQRWAIYRKLWGQVRQLLTIMSQNRLVAEMDKMWPNYFADTTTTSTNSSNHKNDEKKSKKNVQVERNQHGQVILPIQLGASLTIHQLGQVVYDRPNYHTDKYIWPIGFKSTRLYSSVKDPNEKCLYTCEIMDGGESPVFVLTAQDDHESIKGSSATAVWTVVVKRINEMKSEESGKRMFTNISGPEYFGLAHPTVIKLISELEHAEKCIRSNAPHKPESLQVLHNDVVVSSPTVAHVIGGGDDDAMSDDDENSQDALGTKVELSTGQDGQSVEKAIAASGDDSYQNIIIKRQKRDEAFAQISQNCSKEMSNVAWEEGQDLFSFAQSRNDAMMKSLVEFDGANKPLYYHMKLEENGRRRDRNNDNNKKKKKKRDGVVVGANSKGVTSPVNPVPVGSSGLVPAAATTSNQLKPSGKRKFAQTQEQSIPGL
ncbi:hypothetical protein AKO1_012723 [Acrasis kona]|uniref:Uncharacterized protein n=1 Tax=Acrasis kona TaxID=1008807 RepID=A0AAW2YWA2_9EUKA